MVRTSTGRYILDSIATSCSLKASDDDPVETKGIGYFDGSPGMRRFVVIEEDREEDEEPIEDLSTDGRYWIVLKLGDHHIYSRSYIYSYDLSPLTTIPLYVYSHSYDLFLRSTPALTIYSYDLLPLLRSILTIYSHSYDLFLRSTPALTIYSYDLLPLLRSTPTLTIYSYDLLPLLRSILTIYSRSYDLLPLLRSILTIYSHVFGVEYSVDGATGAEEDAEGVAVRLLERQRRDVDIPIALVDHLFLDGVPSTDCNATTTTTSSTTSATTTPTTTPEPVGRRARGEGGGIVEPFDLVDPSPRYYRSQSLRDVDEVQRYWVDLDSLVEEEVITNEMLSASHRRAATVRLTFEFPFYGHLLRNITIATGGFLFTGDFVHTWLAATQYIAPLMANFDTSMSKNASVKYADNGTSFTVQWNNVPLKDHADAGTFTFQVTLHKNGDIVFTYKQVPMFVTAIVDDQHPVKVGLSDAYIVDRTIFFVRRKTIYEYHKIDMKKRNMIGNWTAILFKALPTCVSMHTCTDCLSQKISSFQGFGSGEASTTTIATLPESISQSATSLQTRLGSEQLPRIQLKLTRLGIQFKGMTVRAHRLPAERKLGHGPLSFQIHSHERVDN
ncbi:Plexin domain-containing protein 2 [Chionoecetes opilio]|uniref:Plexin domain-containing protein 2 n=1 Tax=Chionoecetes opilio TaxID=41210 RepID=A0A8J4XUG9_CHIOP|nr:Plexin domain-containing protein 2 [Chionoecetes opilio]